MNSIRNFYEQFEAAAGRFPDRPAVDVQRRESVERFSYAELRLMAERTASFLAARGIAPGERCAILADNDAIWCAAYLGVLRLGGVAVPLDTAYKPKQIAALLRDSGAKILFLAPKYLAAAQEAVTLASASTELVLLGGAAAGLNSFDEILAQPATPLPPCPATRSDPAVTLYTSGTTSDPKGVVLTHGNLLAEMESVFEVVHVNERDSILGVLPLFHALAQLANLLLPFAVGARVIFLEAVNSAELLRALRDRGATLFCCVPQYFYLIHQRVTQEVAAASLATRLAFRTLLGLNGFLREKAKINLGPRMFRRVHDVLGREMRLLVTGGSRLDAAVNRDLYRLGFNLLQAYGLTESCGAATVTRPGSKYSDSVGPPLPGVEVKIAPPERSSDNGAQDGEVLIRGDIVMQGYFNRPDANAEALASGWLHTGDLGYLDGEGRLHITGRSKEIIVLSSGKNIYPEEIEAHYLQSPFIKELCVMGLARPDEPAAERLHAVVVPDFEVLRERKVLNAREILRYEIEGLSVHLPSHKRILGYEIWTEELPRTTTRKLKRFEIERRQRERNEPAGGPDGAAQLLSEEDRAWAARPEVARALELIREAAKQRAAIRPDANIELELGLDSMERVELLTELQTLFGAQVPDEVAHRIYTVRELVEAVLASAADGRTAELCSRAGLAAGSVNGDTWGKLLDATPEDDPELNALLKPQPVFTPVMFLIFKLGYLLARVVFRFRVAGRENLPQQGPFLLCPNHQSYLDAFFLASALPYRVFANVFFVGASEYFVNPLARWFARKINLVPVDPDVNLLRAMQAGAFGLRHGKVLVLFPEGERSIDGAPKKFKKGALILSLHLHAPIAPVALDGVYDIWPRGYAPRWRAFLPGGPGRVSLRFGVTLPPPGELPAEVSLSQAESRYAEDAQRLRDVVLEMWHALQA
ncbi:MAG: AMP-binding protein [Acidobacteria bacterium]|nr:AMP-binding protein [Acidobacteriota bacterium]